MGVVLTTEDLRCARAATGVVLRLQLGLAMHLWKVTTILRLIGATIATVVLVGALVLFAPRIDERANFLTRRSLNLVQEFRTNGRTVRDVVNARYRNAQWTVYHRD